MSALYCYALLGRRPRGRSIRGVSGERVQIIRGPGFVLAGGRLPAPPAVTPRALRRQDRVVRRLAGSAAAVLPFRFGVLVADEAALLARLTIAAHAVRQGLALVAAREQMTLRLAGLARAPTGRRPRPDARPAGPGTRYLRARAGPGLDAGDQRVLAALRAEVGPLLRAEIVEVPRDGGVLRASVYHLIPRGQAAAYRRRVRRAAARHPAVQVVVSGPWPPYAFAATVLP
ncbi:MAG TPA: GvpL/GvpF family gas vesicle protein [Methylomirabilota bacterium]|nr:GvpL/GvpF family gas vesicle protein [Methylomirabilota bacterium]